MCEGMLYKPRSDPPKAFSFTKENKNRDLIFVHEPFFSFPHFFPTFIQYILRKNKMYNFS